MNASTSFFGSRAFNGFPIDVYALRHAPNSSIQLPQNETLEEEELRSVWKQSIVTSFVNVQLNSSENRHVSLVRRVEVNGFLFDFHWLRGNASIDERTDVLPDALFLSFSSSYSTLSLASRIMSFTPELNESLFLPSPQLPDDLPIPSSLLANLSTLNASSVFASFTGSSGLPLVAGEIAFMERSFRENTSSARIILAANLGGGTYGAGYPFIPAPAQEEDEEWHQLMQEQLEAHILYTCRMLETQLFLLMSTYICIDMERRLAEGGALSPANRHVADTYTPESEQLDVNGRMNGYDAHLNTVSQGYAPDSGSSAVKADHAQAKCDEEQRSGNDEPLSVRVYMGVTQGKFNFWYEHYSIKDRTIIRHAGRTIFDTGCTGGTASVEVSLSGAKDPYVEVSVEPNCEGDTSGTAWHFNVGCPEAAVLECEPDKDCFCRYNDESRGPSTQTASPSVNGCGPEGNAKMAMALRFLIDNSFESDFQAVCNVHDTCYGTCSNYRERCDKGMCSGFTQACFRIPTFKKILFPKLFPKCMLTGRVMCDAVRWRGQEPFESAQHNLCTCDPQ
ncbi:hypothetical protein AB1Y20_019466 [Prymnesium parvum]|uniref:Uncharacterized protein n=1 Tax=Prymnesium parvum TaxID=97485 RepID=A0AB34JUH5_PRYPA